MATTSVAGGWLVAAQAAGAAQGGEPLTAARPVAVRPVQPSAPGGGSSAAGNVTVDVPRAAFGPADGLPSVLVRGRDYTVNVLTWIAGGQPKAWVAVRVDGAMPAVCGAGLPSGAVTRVHCVVRAPRVGRSVVSVVASDRTGELARTSFVHAVRA